jgi:hypothetical protein
MSTGTPQDDINEHRRRMRRSTRVSHPAYRLWDELMDSAENGRCLLGQEGLGASLGWPVRTVRRYERELERLGIIRILRDGRQHVYELTVRVPKLGVQPLLPPDPVEELLEETEEEAVDVQRAMVEERNRPRRKVRKARKVDPALGGNAGQMSDKPPPPGTRIVSAKPLVPKHPIDLLNLMIDEVELKYGKRAAGTIGRTLNTEMRGKLRRAVLDKYDDPSLVIAMVRVLVWDWEVIRQECWPYTKANYPNIDRLAKHHAELAAATPTGFEWAGDLRGAVDTYANRYLRREDDDPDELFG